MNRPDIWGRGKAATEANLPRIRDLEEACGIPADAPPIFKAAFWNLGRTFEDLLLMGEPADAALPNGTTVLMAALMGCGWGTLTRILDVTPDPTIPGWDSVVEFALFHGRIEVVYELEKRRLPTRILPTPRCLNAYAAMSGMVAHRMADARSTSSQRLMQFEGAVQFLEEQTWDDERPLRAARTLTVLNLPEGDPWPPCRGCARHRELGPAFEPFVLSPRNEAAYRLGRALVDMPDRPGGLLPPELLLPALEDASDTDEASRRAMRAILRAWPVLPPK